jgi:hypothetical protein
VPRWNEGPYAPGLLPAAAWREGRADRLSGRVRRRAWHGSSALMLGAYERGYLNTRWHRSPNGQLKWHRS